jgi:hypothetical protein
MTEVRDFCLLHQHVAPILCKRCKISCALLALRTISLHTLIVLYESQGIQRIQIIIQKVFMENIEFKNLELRSFTSFF